MNSETTIQSLLRTDFVAFVERCFVAINPGTTFMTSWYVEHLAWQLLQCQAGIKTRLTIALPPRHGKSTIVSVAFPAWLLGHDPALRIICASYSQDLAFRLSADFRRIIESPWYRSLFPNFSLQGGTCTDREVTTTANGWRYATSIGGPMTGIGGDMIIIDDALKASDAKSELERRNAMDWITGTAISRLDNKSTGRIIVVGQRLHIDDPIGRLLASGNWDEVTLPAIAIEKKSYPLARVQGEAVHTRAIGEVLDPAREPPDVLEKVRATMGSAAFNAQYQQRPDFDTDCYIRWEWFFSFDKPPKFDLVFISVDPAIATHANADFTAALVIGVCGDKDYILHVEHKRLGFMALATRLLQLADRYHVDGILIESSGIGISLFEHLHGLLPTKVFCVTPKGSKSDRVIEVLPRIECGQVGILSGTNWLEPLRVEVGAFPNGTHDDQVDALSQYLRHRNRLIRAVATMTGRANIVQHLGCEPTIECRVTAI